MIVPLTGQEILDEEIARTWLSSTAETIKNAETKFRGQSRSQTGVWERGETNLSSLRSREFDSRRGLVHEKGRAAGSASTA